MDKKYSDVFLARWLSDEVTDEEKSNFEASEDYLIYKKIAEKSTEFRPPEFKKDQILKKIQEKTYIKKQQKKISLFKPWTYAAAASVALFFGLFYFLNQPEKYVCATGEKLAITLPDNSKVLLNSNSTLTYHKKNWNNKRTLKLNGEAYFKVAKGTDFIVETKEGKVTVLGTEFNVKTDKDLFEVICFEGKVKAETAKLESILTKGNAFRKIKNSLPEKWNITETEPSWQKGETTFKSMPLKHVIMALKNQYGINIDASKIDINKKFTGGFTHKNLDIALQTVFAPMKIGITFQDKKTILLYKQ